MSTYRIVKDTLVEADSEEEAIELFRQLAATEDVSLIEATRTCARCHDPLDPMAVAHCSNCAYDLTQEDR